MRSDCLCSNAARDGAEFKEAKKQFVCRYEGGESMLHLAQRIYNLLDDVRAEAEEKTYILVAHNGIARLCFQHIRRTLRL